MDRRPYTQYALIQVLVLSWTTDIPSIYPCFEIYNGYLWLSQVILSLEYPTPGLN